MSPFSVVKVPSQTSIACISNFEGIGKKQGTDKPHAKKKKRKGK